MLFSEKVTLAMIILTIVFLILTWNRGLEVFVVLILIGVLILRELTDSFASSEVKERINFFIYTGLIIFIGIVLKEIMDIHPT